MQDYYQLRADPRQILTSVASSTTLKVASHHFDSISRCAKNKMRFLKKKKNVSKTCNCNSDVKKDNEVKEDNDVKKDKDVKEGSNPEEGEKDSADQTNENSEIPVDLLFSKKY